MPDRGICSTVVELWNATVVVALLNRSPHHRRATPCSTNTPLHDGAAPSSGSTSPLRSSAPVIPSEPRLWRTGDPSEAEGGVVQALCVNNWWRGYLTDYGEPSKLVFSLQDRKPVLCMKGDVQVTVEPKGRNRHWDYEVTGSFVQRSCAIKNRAGQVAAQIGVKGMMAGRDFYQVVVQPGYDQAFVVGVIAILDNIHGESTRC